MEHPVCTRYCDGDNQQYSLLSKRHKLEREMEDKVLS